MTLGEWREELADPARWRHQFGSPEEPVVIAALDRETLEAIAAIHEILSGRGVRAFVVGPTGVGKSVLLGALISEATARNYSITIVSAATDPSALRAVAQGSVQVLVVNRLDELSASVRRAILDNRGRCSVGVVASAERLSAVTAAALTDPLDRVINLPPLENRPHDILAISQLLWPEICGEASDLLRNCLDEAAESLSKGPYLYGVNSLRGALEQLADALITSGDLRGGEFRRIIEARDIADALLASIRGQHLTASGVAVDAVIVVEGSTDATYLSAAASLAEQVWGWKLLDGCQLLPAGEERRGGAGAVWRRLFELSGRSVECVGLFDNDDVGRREYAMARRQNLRAELLPAEFDRLRLPDEHRCLEIEDLLCLRILDRFYRVHPHSEPEEVRLRVGGLRRVAPQGADKESLAEWASREMVLEECERLIYVLCRLRKSVGLPVPRNDMDNWLQDLLAADC